LRQFCSHFSECPYGKRLGDRYEDLGDQVGFGGGAGVVDVVFDVEVVADGEFLVRDHLEDAAGGFGEIGVRAGECEAGVLAAGELGVLEAGREIFGFGGKADTGAVDLRSYFVKAGVGGDLVVFADGRDKLLHFLPGLRSVVLKWAGLFNIDVVGFGPGDDFGLAGEI
jgi:hypothetical protein